MKLALAPPAVHVARRGDVRVLTSPLALPQGPPHVLAWLERHAAATPSRTLFAERTDGGGWRHLSYAAAVRAVQGLSAALLELGAGPGRPVALLAGNSIDHALVSLAAQRIGAPAAPISPAYSLQSDDFARLRVVCQALRPAVVWVDDPAPYQRALQATGLDQLPVIASTEDAPLRVAALARTADGTAAREAADLVGPDTVAKVLFTSGSTGVPRGVLTTQRMLVTNQEALAACWPFLADAPPVLVDWLPWSHCFGGSFDVHLVLRQGGTMYLDDGRPAPGWVERTVHNLREVSPTLYFNVPRGYDLLLPHLEADAALRTSFFRRLQTAFFAGAALPPATRARIEAVARRAGRDDLFLSSAWGATETAPLTTLVHFPTDTPAVIGLPVPGVELKLAPVGDRFELRVRGPNLTPGYRVDGDGVEPPTLDADGFWRTGDAARLCDPERPELGVVFEGRLGENFKLGSGVWVTVGQLRVALLDHTGPLVRDAVITGHGRDHLGALLFAGPAWDDDGADPQALRQDLRDRLVAFNRTHTGSSERIARALVLHVPPSLDAGETTDKGYTNQRRVLERRAAEVARVHAAVPDAEVLVLS